MQKHCLNCETQLHGAYCHKCGQKASTHRITFSKFVTHDLLHGVFHLDKGILYTLKCLIFSPGYAVKSFISGKRVLHYNIFALFIIIVALKTFVDAHTSDLYGFRSVDAHETDETINEVINHYYKFFYLLSIPILSIFTFLLSKKLKYNYTEHIVFNCFLLTGGFFYSLVLSILGLLTGIGTGGIGGLVIITYLFWGYYQATKDVYSFWGYLWRILTIIISFMLSLLLIIVAIIFIFYDGGFHGSVRF